MKEGSPQLFCEDTFVPWERLREPSGLVLVSFCSKRNFRLILSLFWRTYGISSMPMRLRFLIQTSNVNYSFLRINCFKPEGINRSTFLFVLSVTKIMFKYRCVYRLLYKLRSLSISNKDFEVSISALGKLMKQVFQISFEC